MSHTGVGNAGVIPRDMMHVDMIHSDVAPLRTWCATRWSQRVAAEHYLALRSMQHFQFHLQAAMQGHYQSKPGAPGAVLLLATRLHDALPLPVSVPLGSKPSLMTFREVETLFHEFGHALQHMLTEVREGMASGIRCVGQRGVC